MSYTNSESLVEMGQSMKKYAIAQWISMGGGLIAGLILLIVTSTFIPQTGSSTMGNIGGMMIIIIIFGILMLAISIYNLVCFIQFLIKLKIAGEETGDQNLQKAYKMQIATLIISILLPIIMLIIMVPIFTTFINNPTEDITSIIFGLLVPYLLLMLGALVAVVLQILSVVAIDSWGQSVRAQDMQDINSMEIAEGTNLMKWGQIVNIIAGGIGTIIYIVGLQKAGKNIEIYFQNHSFSGSSASGPQMASYYGQSQTTMGNQMYQSAPSNAQTTPLSHCPYCGNQLPDPNASFCSICGKKIR
ncbi:MAG: zinc ribbon domain-containing protein [Promethearchaeota archaeon]